MRIRAWADVARRRVMRMVVGALTLAVLPAIWSCSDAKSVHALLDAVTPGASAAGATSASIRKCVSPAKVFYTDGVCPSGSREQGVTQGSVMVVPHQAVDKRADHENADSDHSGQGAPRRKNVRDVLAPPDAQWQAAKDRRMNEIVDR